MARREKSKSSGWYSALDRQPTVDEGGKPVEAHGLAAEQTHEADESARAKNAEASSRQWMARIGRANQQTGRRGRG